MVPELFVVGLVVGFLYYELVGVSPGGVIPPAYFALFLHQPERMGVTVVLALAVWGGIRILQRHTFLFGRRRLLAAMLLGFGAKWLAEQVLAPAMAAPFEIHAIGFIVPGLIANDMVRQSVAPTLLSLGIVTVVTGLVGLLIGVGWGGP
ncbi:MAG: poly-gamma-glutamate biosynthesis protein PgsC [bacterium]|nr:poly-gamma-glutamate biosynthesis protein PgsC [bacterium]